MNQSDSNYVEWLQQKNVKLLKVIAETVEAIKGYSVPKKVTDKLRDAILEDLKEGQKAADAPKQRFMFGDTNTPPEFYKDLGRPDVESLARAACVESGRDPEELVPESGYPGARKVPLWWMRQADALSFIAFYNATMEKFREGQRGSS